MSLVVILVALTFGSVLLDPVDMRWTFGAREPYVTYRRVGCRRVGLVDAIARWFKLRLDETFEKERD